MLVLFLVVDDVDVCRDELVDLSDVLTLKVDLVDVPGLVVLTDEVLVGFLVETELVCLEEVVGFFVEDVVIFLLEVASLVVEWDVVCLWVEDDVACLLVVFADEVGDVFLVDVLVDL